MFCDSLVDLSAAVVDRDEDSVSLGGGGQQGAGVGDQLGPGLLGPITWSWASTLSKE